MGKAVARPVGGKTKAERMAEAQRILEAHLAGVPAYDICREYGISKPTMYRRIQKALQFRIAPDVDRYRQEQGARLDMYRRRLLEELARPGGILMTEGGLPIPVGRLMGTDAAAVVGKLLATEERLAKLYGLDAPAKVEHSVNVQDSFERLLEELGANDPAPEGAADPH